MGAGHGTLAAGALAVVLAGDAAAQTLDDQLDFFLREQCAALQFERDGPFLAPGQASAALASVCGGPPQAQLPAPGTTTTVAVSGGAAAAAAVSRGAESARESLRRRQQDLREDDPEAPRGGAAGDTTNLARWGRWGIFLGGGYERLERDPTAFEDGQQAHTVSLNLGADYRLGGSGVMGIAASLARQSGDFDSGGDYGSRRLGITMLASWFPSRDSFLDLAGGFGRQRLDTSRIASRDVITTAADGNQTVSFEIPPAGVDADVEAGYLEAYLLAGHDFSAGAVTAGPRLGLEAVRRHTDAYTETGDSPMTLAFDDQTEVSLRSTLGVQLSAALTPAFGVLVPQFNADWVHEFRDDQRDIRVRFAGDLRDAPVEFTFQDAPPDRDFFRLRLGLAAVLPMGLSLFASGHGQLGHETDRLWGASVGARLEVR